MFSKFLARTARRHFGQLSQVSDNATKQMIENVGTELRR